MSDFPTDSARPLGNYPYFRRSGHLVFVSGTSSRRPDNTHEGATQREDGSWELDIRAQTRAVFQNVGRILSSAGLSLHDVVDCTTFLVNMDDFPGYNEVYSEFFDAETGPARTTVAVHQLPHPNLLIEVKVIAAG